MNVYISHTHTYFLCILCSFLVTVFRFSSKSWRAWTQPSLDSSFLLSCYISFHVLSLVNNLFKSGLHHACSLMVFVSDSVQHCLVRPRVKQDPNHLTRGNVCWLLRPSKATWPFTVHTADSTNLFTFYVSSRLLVPCTFNFCLSSSFKLWFPILPLITLLPPGHFAFCPMHAVWCFSLVSHELYFAEFH